ncbi:MAG TPA: CoA transferase, partial [Dehalococcoidia bacterium]|nr:CoA transferase [Dehalococcoidia bacterium]
MSGACDGLRVVDFTSWMAGPLATMVLADNGADVIKVEPPAGDPARGLPAFQTWNRGKRSVVLDLKTPEGRDKALALAAGADAVFVAMRPGTPQKLRIDYERLREANPRLVYASITGYGEDGPWARLKGYDALVTARSGRMMMFERVADRPGPAFPSLPCASYTAAMLSLQGVMAALHRRAATGRGQKVSVSLLASLIPYDLIMWIGWQLRGDDIDAAAQPANMVLQKLLGERQMAQKPGSYDPKQLHRPQVRVPRPNYLTAVTKDGVWLQFANTMDHLCVAQMTALGLLDLYGQERFAKLPAVFTEEDAEDLWETVLERVRSKTYEEWRPIFEEEGNIAVERIRSPLESLEHRQIVHNGQSVEVPGLTGNPTVQPGPLALFGETPGDIRSGAPSLGQHTAEVLGALPAGPRVSSEPTPVPETSAVTTGPLTGVTIIDFSAWIAAPYATGILANLGARVIRIEPVGGDVSRYSTGGLLSFPMTQGKESIALDLKHPDGLKVVQSLIARADGVVHNFRPGVPERLGIDYESCLKLNPRLIYLNAASYGESGPDSHRPMFFATAAALGGNQLRQAGAGHPAPGSERADIEDLKNEAWRVLKSAEGNADPIAAVAAAAAFLMAL